MPYNYYVQTFASKLLLASISTFSAFSQQHTKHSVYTESILHTQLRVQSHVATATRTCRVLLFALRLFWRGQPTQAVSFFGSVMSNWVQHFYASLG